MVQQETYRQQSKVFLEDAKKYLEEGNLYQASEKGWGAAAQIVKAVAEGRGWRHRRHDYLQEVIDHLTAVTNDDNYVLLFASANALHSNFYEGYMAQRSVALHLAKVSLLIEELERLRP